MTARFSLQALLSTRLHNMAIFQDITLSFGGDDFIVKADNVLGLIAEIEEIVTIGELLDRKHIKAAKISKAFGVALRYAGARVRDDEIYLSMFKDGESGRIFSTINELLLLMTPPAELIDETAGEGEKKP